MLQTCNFCKGGESKNVAPLKLRCDVWIVRKLITEECAAMSQVDRPIDKQLRRKNGHVVVGNLQYDAAHRRGELTAHSRIVPFGTTQLAK